MILPNVLYISAGFCWFQVNNRGNRGRTAEISFHEVSSRAGEWINHGSGISARANSVNARLLVTGALLFALIVMGALIAPGSEEPEHPLRVGANVWPGYEPLFLAESLGYYNGQNIEIITFPSSAEVMRAYRNQAIDVAAVTADEALQISETLPG